MSALCGFPSTLFDLFLESNVMIVANFEIWKHTCCVAQSTAPLHGSCWHVSAAAFCCFRHFKYWTVFDLRRCLGSGSKVKRLGL